MIKPLDGSVHFFDAEVLPGSDGQRMSDEAIRGRIQLLESALPYAGENERRELRNEVGILMMVLGHRRRNPSTGRGYRTIGEEAYDWVVVSHQARKEKR